MGIRKELKELAYKVQAVLDQAERVKEATGPKLTTIERREAETVYLAAYLEAMEVARRDAALDERGIPLLVLERISPQGSQGNVRVEMAPACGCAYIVAVSNEGIVVKRGEDAPVVYRPGEFDWEQVWLKNGLVHGASHVGHEVPS